MHHCYINESRLRKVAFSIRGPRRSADLLVGAVGYAGPARPPRPAGRVRVGECHGRPRRVSGAPALKPVPAVRYDRHIAMKTLIVEDDAVTRRLLEGLLRSRGHEVTACADAESAWQAYQRHVYPLVVLDWMLPGKDGLALCRDMRTLPHGDRSVIVVLTGRDRPEDLQAVLAAGADDYLTKPVAVPLLQVRLSIAERQVDQLALRKGAEARVAVMMDELQQSRDDLRSILNRLRIGSAITDEQQRVTFLSEAAQRLLGAAARPALGEPWERLWPCSPADLDQLRDMVARPAARREKVAVHVQVSGGRDYWMDVEVHDDPRDPQRRIFFLYDTSDVHSLRQLLDEKAQFEDLVGKSAPMALVYQQIRDFAAVDTTVLIEGETGTGKELVARALHFSSRRRDNPFVAVNCAGLTESLLGSQLFGHKRGAFTGAIEDHKGLFEAADGGTIFLDEIGDVPLSVQTVLLRVLQEREITRLGESKPRKIDVRVVCATHHNLAEDVASGTFRSDLLYRVRVARLRLPALRERREDIPLLAGAFLSQCAAVTGKRVDGITTEAMGALMGYAWPGNVRELRSAIEFGVVRSKGAVLDVQDLPPEVLEATDLEAPLISETAEPDPTQRLVAALEAAKGNRVLAARMLGISRATLYRRLAELNIPLKQQV